MKSFNEMLQRLPKSNATVAIAGADDVHVLEAAVNASIEGIAKFLLFGDKQKIDHIIKKSFPTFMHHETFTIKNAESTYESAIQAIQSVKNRQAQILMKGNIPTSDLLKLVLHREEGLRTDKILSHVAMFEFENFNRLITLTDAAINLYPTVEQKKQIIDHAVKIVEKVGIHLPKVAVLAPVEIVNPTMQATVDAAILTQMNNRGQIQDCIVDGPLSLDNIISMDAAMQKNINSEVAGKADIILTPNIDVGNSLYKSFIYVAHAKVGAIVAGASSPIVLTSRADSSENRLNSLVLALYQAHHN